MRINSEPYSPLESSLRLIEQVAEEIRPEQAELADWYEEYVENQKVRLAFDLDYICSCLPIQASILECGTIPLLLTAALKQLGYKIFGIDLSPERFASSINRLELMVVKCDIEKEQLPWERGFFDAVLFNELFEHLRINPIFSLREVWRVLRPGGVLLLSTPNLHSLGGMMNYLLHQRTYPCCVNTYTEYDKIEQLGHMGHVREYTPRDVTDFLNRIGFVVDGLIFRGRYERLWQRLAVKMIPSLRPYFTVEAHKLL